MSETYYLLNGYHIVLVLTILWCCVVLVFALGKIEHRQIRNSCVLFLFNQIMFTSGVAVTGVLSSTHNINKVHAYNTPVDLIVPLEKADWLFIFDFSFWEHLTWGALYLTPLFQLFFYYTFIGRKFDSAFRMIASVSVLLSLSSLFLEQMVSGVWSIPLLAFVTTPCMLYGLFLCAQAWWLSKTKMESKRNTLLLTAAGLPVVFYIVFDLVLNQLLGVVNLIEYIIVFSGVVPAPIFLLAILRYGSLKINLQYAAESLFSGAKDPVLLIDQHQKIVRANPTAQDKFDVPAYSKDDSGRSIYELIPQFDSHQQRFDSTIAVGADLKIFACSSSSIRTGNDEVGRILLLRDVTRERELNAMKSEFTSTVSHELRTPLTSILGFARIIKKRLEEVILPKTDIQTKRGQRAVRQIRQNLQVVVNEGQRLTQLINDVLDISKMEAGKLEWRFQRVQISDLIDAVLQENQELIASKDIRFISDIATDLPEMVADPGRIQQVIDNLLQNALKFTDNGRVKLTVNHLDGEMLLSIKDTGIGVDKENREKIFYKYQQVGDVLTDKPTGTGLGLPICREIIERHGGKIWMESIEDVGSNFSFSVPIPVYQKAPSDVVSLESVLTQWEQVDVSAAQSGDSILIIDDELHIREMLRQALESTGYKITEAADGVEGLESIRNQMPALIIVDVMMPRLNGFEVVTILKNDPRTIHLPILMLTIVEERNRGYGLGVDLYLKKPIAPEEIAAQVQNVLALRDRTPTALFVGDPGYGSSGLRKVLERAGHMVHSISDATDLSIVLERIKPDMIFVEDESFPDFELDSLWQEKEPSAPYLVKRISRD